MLGSTAFAHAGVTTRPAIALARATTALFATVYAAAPAPDHGLSTLREPTTTTLLERWERSRKRSIPVGHSRPKAGPGAIPVTDGVDGEGVAEVVEARPARAGLADRCSADEASEYVKEILVDDAGPDSRREEPRPKPHAEPVAHGNVLPDRCGSGAVKGDEPGPLELCVPHLEQRPAPV